MSNINNRKENENIAPKGSTTRSLVSFLTTTCFSRINSKNINKLENYKDKVKEMLTMEEKQHRGEKERYDYLRQIVDSFFDYIRDEKTIQKIQEGKLNKSDLEDNFLEDILKVPKRKYDMSHLYNSHLIATQKENSDLKKAKIFLRNNVPEYVLADEDGKQIILTDIGTVAYEDWTGLQSDIPIYQMQKEQNNGNFKQKVVCTRIIMPELMDSEYRKAIIKELFSDRNLEQSNTSAYIGQILKQKSEDKEDLPKTESQTTFKYKYRVSDNYVLEYDATELSAVVEAVKQYVKDLKRENKAKKDIEEDGKELGEER